MKKLIILLCLIIGFYSCNTSKNVVSNSEETALKEKDTVRIANDDLEYEIIIIEPGFNFWLNSRARQRGYYSQEYLENKNQIYVAEWNARVLNPSIYNSSLYQWQIDYSPHIDYGYEVNYMLYNYFIYFQINYKQKLAGFIPRI